MNIKKIAMVCAVAGVAACTPPKVMVSNFFVDTDKSVKTIIQQSDEDKKLFNVFMRVCDVAGTNTEANCKETKVLGNVAPGSIY